MLLEEPEEVRKRDGQSTRHLDDLELSGVDPLTDREQAEPGHARDFTRAQSQSVNEIEWNSVPVGKSAEFL